MKEEREAMKWIVLRGQNLNTTVYRGFAPLAELARVSQADIFNQDTNALGLQRDLSDTHSREAYRYAAGIGMPQEQPRTWAEMLLNVRDRSVAKLTPLDERHGLFEIEVREDLINKRQLRPQISRVDGNHRLHYAAGHPRNEDEWKPLTEVYSSFAITIDYPAEAEVYLFVDINKNQKPMNTAHLAHLRFRMTPEQQLVAKEPELWIATRLTDDPESPWFNQVHKGGSRTQGNKRRINLASLKTGVKITLQDGVKMRSMDITAQYNAIRLFWQAVAAVYAEAWTTPDTCLLKGIGVWTLSHLGAEILDRCFVRGIPPVRLKEEISTYLQQTKTAFDWQGSSDIQNYGGRTGAKLAAERMKEFLADDDVNIMDIAAALKNLG
jgi:DGQHR domain-containing protein